MPFLGLGLLAMIACGGEPQLLIAPPPPPPPPPPAPVLTAVSLSPGSTFLLPGGQQRFTATATWSDGSTTVPPVQFSSTGGVITDSGLYSSGPTNGDFWVAVTADNGRLTDTSRVSIADPGAVPVGYDPGRLGPAMVVGESWQDLVLGSDSGFTSVSKKGWRQGTNPYPKPVPGQIWVDVDPVFGKAVRIVHPDYHSNKFASTVEHIRTFPAVSRFWYRAVVRVSGNGNRNGQLGQGFTSWGSGTLGGSTTYKMLFAFTESGSSRMEFVLFNDGQFLVSFGQAEQGRVETLMTQTVGTPVAPVRLGAWTGGAEWRTNGDWYEFIMNYEKVTATEYIQRYFIRRLTANGTWNPWATPAWSGYRITNGVAQSYRKIHLGGNKSQTNDGPFDQYLWWGPWEVTTEADPYGWDHYGK